MRQTVIVHRDAPPKPASGQPCNGCGICCAAEPCPAGRLLLLHRRGPCPALAWDMAGKRHVCGLLTEPERHLPWLPGSLLPLAVRLFARAIAAGRGCDSDATELR